MKTAPLPPLHTASGVVVPDLPHYGAAVDPVPIGRLLMRWLLALLIMVGVITLFWAGCAITGFIDEDLLEGTAFGLVIFVLHMILIVFLMLACVLWAIWLRRICINTFDLTPRYLSGSPVAIVVCSYLPIVNFFANPQAFREIWTVAQNPREPETARRSKLPLIWMIVFHVFVPLGFILFAIGFDTLRYTYSSEEIAIGYGLYFATYILVAIYCFLTFRLVRAITWVQSHAIRSLKSAE